MWLKLSLLIAPIFIITPLTSADTGWQVGQYAMEIDSNSQPDYQYFGDYAFGTPEDGPQIMFTCSARAGIATSIFLERKTVDEVFSAKWKKISPRRVEMKLGDGAPKIGKWFYIRARKSIHSTERWQSIRLVNGIITSTTTQMNVPRIGKLTIKPPALDDRFRRFIADCPQLNGG